MPGLADLTRSLADIRPTLAEGSVREIAGDRLVIGGLDALVSIGDGLRLKGRDGQIVRAEVTGSLRDGVAAAAIEPITAIGAGTRVELARSSVSLSISSAWIGRVVDPFGRPLDGRGSLGGGQARPLRAAPIAATARARLGARLDFGISALDAFAPCRAGQRLGLFAGAGVGKSTLLGMLARNVGCDVTVLALVGERGREVREFLEDELGPDGRARTVAIVATSDMPAAARRSCAEAAMTVAEFFRDQGAHVLLLVDSLTRYCAALREIGLAAGELPAARGFPPSTFGQLPRLLERAGPGLEPAPGQTAGHITALFSVLVDGDDQTADPVADAARGFLDGHIILDRGIAERGRYPAIDVLRSLSRTASSCLTPEQSALMLAGRRLLAQSAELEELVKLGAYRRGTDPECDRVLTQGRQLDAFLQQSARERSPDPFDTLRGIVRGPV